MTAIGTGIGVLGFVMFFGGFVLWTRFEEAGLPANEAVARVPRNDLVATGASFLVPAVLAALVTSLVAVTGWDFAIGSKRRERQRKAEDARLQVTKLVVGLEDEERQLKRQEKQHLDEAERQQGIGDAAKAGSQEQTEADAARRRAEAKAADVKKKLDKLVQEEIPAKRRAQEEAVEAARSKSSSENKGERIVQIAIGVLPMAITSLIIFLLALESLGFWQAVLLFSAAAVTIAVAIVVISMTDHFAWFTVCVFLGIGLTIAVSTYLRTQSHVKVSPATALSDSSPVVGFFVAETSDALYVGRPQPAETPERADSWGFETEGTVLLRYPKESLTGLTIGPIMDADKAYRRSLELALALCRKPATATGEATKAPAASRQSKKEKEKAGAQRTGAQPTACNAKERKLLVKRLAAAP